MTRQVFRFNGGHPALDFVNTVAWRLGKEPADKLLDYDSLVDWSKQSGLLGGRAAAALRRDALQSPSAAARVLAGAVLLREVIYRLCDALRHKRRPDVSDLRQLNRFVSEVQRGTAIQWSGNRLSWGAPDPGLDSMLPPLTRAAAELLTSDQARRIAQCQDEDGCGWLFLDKSRSRARQWCSMADCGNRAKARRHYRRSH